MMIFNGGRATIARVEQVYAPTHPATHIFPERSAEILSLQAAFDQLAGAGKSTSAPADAIDRTSTIPHCSRPHRFARNRARNGPRPQHDASPRDTTDGIVHVLAIHHGTRLLGACG